MRLEPVTTQVQDRDLRDAIQVTWERLPIDARQRLEDVRFIEDHTIAKSWGQADICGDIYVRPLPRHVPRLAAMGIIAHECAHLAGGHHRRIAAGAMSRAEAEADADRICKAWGFSTELMVRALFLGR